MGLTQLRRNDEKLDEQLELISKGMQRLKGIANDQNNEVRGRGRAYTTTHGRVRVVRLVRAVGGVAVGS